MVVALIFWLSVSFILYTYFGYPLLVASFARLKPKLGKYQPIFPFVTLLIAAFNEEESIEEKIENSIALDYPKDKLQILIVTDGSSDATPKIVERFTDSGIELLHKPDRQGKMAAINRAMPQARGEIIVFSDANNKYAQDTIKKLIAPFADPSVGAVSGAKVIESGDGSLGNSEGTYWKYESFIKKQESRLGSCTSAAGEILAIRKDQYISPPSNIINDDFFIAMQIIRQGYRLIYAPDAKSSERVSPTAQDEVKRRTRINAGRYQIIALAGQILPFNQPMLVWQIISHKFLRPLVPFFMIGAVVSNIVAVLFPPISNTLFYLGKPFNWIFLALQAAFYVAALIGMLFNEKGKKSGFARLLYLPTFLTNSNFAALQGFFQFVSGKQSHMWERIQRR